MENQNQNTQEPAPQSTYEIIIEWKYKYFKSEMVVQMSAHWWGEGIFRKNSFAMTKLYVLAFFNNLFFFQTQKIQVKIFQLSSSGIS